jgi:hypothetical protein
MSGQGIIETKKGDTFEGRYELVDGYVKFKGRLVTRTLQGKLYRPEVTRLWPRERIASIRDGGVA